MFFRGNVSSRQIAFWLRERIKKILFVFSLLAFCALAFIGWSQWRKDQGKKVRDSLYEMKKSLTLLAEGAEGEKAPGGAALKETDPPPFTPEMKSQAVLYEKALRQNQKSSVSPPFAVDLADFYYRRGEREKAKNLLAPFALPGKSSSLYHLASFQLASYYMDERDCEKALPLLSGLSSNEKAEAWRLESALQSAICLERAGRWDQALHKYEDLINKDPEGYMGRLARDYKKLLILSRKLKNQAPPEP